MSPHPKTSANGKPILWDQLIKAGQVLGGFPIASPKRVKINRAAPTAARAGTLSQPPSRTPAETTERSLVRTTATYGKVLAFLRQIAQALGPMPPTKKFSFPSREEEEGPAEDWRSLSYRWMGGDRVLEARFGRRLASELEWAEAIEEGLPTEALEAAMKRSALSWEEIGDLVIPRRTFSHRKEKEQSLTPEESDRLLRLLRAVAKAKGTFQSEEKAERWLKKENRALGGQTPLEALKTECGARLVENVLGRISHGVYS